MHLKNIFLSFQDVSNIGVPMTASNTQDRIDSSGQWTPKSVFLFKICKIIQPDKFHVQVILKKTVCLPISLDDGIMRGNVTCLKLATGSVAWHSS